MHAGNSSEFLLALDSIQARSQVFYGEVQSKKETDQMRPEGQVSTGGSFGCLRLNCAASLQLGGGGVDFERVNVSHRGLSGGMLPRKKNLILSLLKWLEMHLKLTWFGETYILSTTTKFGHKKKTVALIGVLISSK